MANFISLVAYHSGEGLTKMCHKAFPIMIDSIHKPIWSFANNAFDLILHLWHIRAKKIIEKMGWDLPKTFKSLFDPGVPKNAFQ